MIINFNEVGINIDLIIYFFIFNVLRVFYINNILIKIMNISSHSTVVRA